MRAYHSDHKSCTQLAISIRTGLDIHTAEDGVYTNNASKPGRSKDDKKRQCDHGLRWSVLNGATSPEKPYEGWPDSKN